MSNSYETWACELAYDTDKDFLLAGISDRFHIINNTSTLSDVHRLNYKSAPAPDVRPLIEQQIRSEISEGHYRIVTSKPPIVSALGAIPKPNSAKYRLIHDCSRPLDNAVNDYAVHTKFSYQRLDEAVLSLRPQVYLAKVDHSSVYRSVRSHPSNYSATGLQWHFSGAATPTFLNDTRLPLGAS